MATPMQRQIEASVGINRSKTRAARTKRLKTQLRRVTRGGAGG